MNIGYILKRLENATVDGLIEWEGTGQEIEIRGQRIRGLSGSIEGLAITTLVGEREVKGFFGRIKTKKGYAIKINTGMEKETFTSDPKIIQGIENGDVFSTVIELSEMADIKLILSLGNKLEEALDNE